MNRGLFELVGEDVIKEPIMNFTQQFSDALIPTNASVSPRFNSLLCLEGIFSHDWQITRCHHGDPDPRF